MARGRQAARRIALYGATAILALVALALAIGFTLNNFDENLAPDTVALLKAPPNPYPPQQNIYLALVGFDAAQGRSVLEVGRERVATFNQDLDATLRNPTMSSAGATITDSAPLKFTGRIDFCHPQTASCWDGIQNHDVETRQLLTDNRDLYLRYLALHGLQGYYETSRPSYLAPIRFVPPEVRALFLADVSLRMKRGNAGQRQDALADLHDDIQLWRRVLIGDGRFESKMAAVASLQSDYLVLADMIADPQADLAFLSRDPQSGVPLFALEDWKLPNAFAAQYRSFAADWTLTELMYSGTDRSIESHYFKFNATQNLAARQIRQLISVAQAPASQVYAAHGIYERWERDNLAPYTVGTTYDPAVYVEEAPGIFRRWGQRKLNLFSALLNYNPVGKVLVANSIASSMDAFSLRAYDGAALQRLVRLSYEIRLRRLDAASIPSFLEGHPEWATHPVNGHPFVWNAARDEIAIQSVAKQRPGNRFSVRIWRND